MKKFFVIFLSLFVACCSQSDKYHDINCKRVDLITKAAQMTLMGKEENDKELADIGVCITGEMYKLENSIVKEVLHSEEKGKLLMTNLAILCAKKLKTMTKQEYDTMAKEAIKALELSKSATDCLD